MKKTIFKMLAIALIGMTTFACQKEGPKGEQGIQGEPGPSAKNYEFILTFPAGSTFQQCPTVSNWADGDALLFFTVYETLSGEDYYISLPYSNGTFTFAPEFGETNGISFINAYNDNTFTSPFTTSSSFKFKMVHIKASGLILHPDVDLTDYKEVYNTFVK